MPCSVFNNKILAPSNISKRKMRVYRLCATFTVLNLSLMTFVESLLCHPPSFIRPCSVSLTNPLPQTTILEVSHPAPKLANTSTSEEFSASLSLVHFCQSRTVSICDVPMFFLNCSIAILANQHKQSKNWLCLPPTHGHKSKVYPRPIKHGSGKPTI